MHSFFYRKKPYLTFLFLLSVSFFLATNIKNITIDASAKTLLKEGDRDYKITKEIDKRFSSDDFLVVTFRPKLGSLLSKSSLETIDELSKRFKELSLTKSVISILNIPLLQSSNKPLSEILSNIPTLKSKDINLTLAKREFLNSPIYSNNLVSKDFKTTAILIYLKDNFTKDQRHIYIKQIRDILKSNYDKAAMFLGGVNMIADDIITFIKKDISIFGSLVFFLLIVILWILFKEIRWVILAVALSIISVIFSTGFLGLLSAQITVVSSNFISFQLIITISIIIHLAIKFKELLSLYPDLSEYELSVLTLKKMFRPILFVILTTVVGFISLIFSGIKPVINLGWMMSLSIFLSFLVSYIFFPLLVKFLKLKNSKTLKSSVMFTHLLLKIVFNYKFVVIFLSILGLIFALYGSKRLIVENSFINYFKKDSQIYQGMKVIDKELGGTTPLDVIVTFKNDKEFELEDTDINDDEFEDFEDEYGKDDKKYWFTQEKITKIEKIHRYLDSLKPVGKVLSLYTTLRLAEELKKDKIDAFDMALLYKELPQKIKKILIDPYVDVEKNQARITLRVIDSYPNLRRDELIKKIKRDIADIINPKEDSFLLSNLLILYNNMLQSLFNSQIKTLLFTAFMLFLMFLILFKSIKVSLIAIFVNILPISVILGVMGNFKIPLDIMTITIAAISMGIAVDNTIHYIYRLRDELKRDQDYVFAIKRSHNSIGIAMYYTSFSIIIGFSVLLFSEFMPTVYFGLLVLLAMFLALFCDLILLPILLLLFRPKY